MLEEVYIKNFILIEELNLQFTAGLNVLTGETGAGKSIIIDALGLIKGARINTDFIRDGREKSIVQAVFDISHNLPAHNVLNEYGLPVDTETLILSREFFPNGKSVARVNGRTVNLYILKAIASYLLDMHGQDDRDTILKPAVFLAAVDAYVDNLSTFLEPIQELYEELTARQAELKELQISEQERNQRLDFLNLQIEEIESVNPQPGEYEELEQLRKRIEDSRQLLEGCDSLLNLLYSSEQFSSAYDLVYQAMNNANRLKNDPFFAEVATMLENIYYSLQEIAERLTSFKGELDFQPGLLEATQERLYQIRRLQKKYGEEVDQILDYVKKAREERERLANSAFHIEELKDQISRLEARYLAVARELSQKRREAKKKLEKAVYRELKDLNLPHIQFEVEISTSPQPGRLGMDKVEFLFSANPGEQLQPLKKAASGGEISRFILALKKALAENYYIPTLIFDEIEAGLGGSALNAMAAKLGEFAASHQLILVTHSPQIAAYAANHLHIEKRVSQDKTLTIVKSLDSQEERIKEICRMLDGENYSELSMQHAKEMLYSARKKLAADIQ